MQLDHSTSRFQSKRFPITIICDGIQSPANMGGLFRVSEAMGVEQLIFCNSELDLNSARLKKTARNTQLATPSYFSSSIVDEIDQLKSKNYVILALEITEFSKPLKELKLDQNTPTAWIIGNERTGITKTALMKTNLHYHIDMFGVNSSMNVIQAIGMALFYQTNL